MATTNISSSGVLGFNDTTGAVPLPSGTTAERPGSASNGEMRFNTDNNNVEYYDGASWIDFSLISLPPSVTTLAASSVASSTMTLNGNLTDLGGATTGSVGFYFGTSTNYASNTKYTVSTSATTGTFLYNATGLSGGASYYINAFAINDGAETVGTQVTQTTTFVPSLVVSQTSALYGKSSASYANPDMFTQFYNPATTAYVQIDSFQNGNGTVTGYTYFNGVSPYVGINGCRGNYYGGFPSGKNFYNMWDNPGNTCKPALRVCTNSINRTYGGAYAIYYSGISGCLMQTTAPCCTYSLNNRVLTNSGSVVTASIGSNSQYNMTSTITSTSGSGGGHLIHEFTLY
jgi:hypothetical protein